AYGMPVAVGDLAVVAATRHPGRSALLLAAVDAIRKSVVGGDVEHLPGRLIVPRAPRLTAVHGDRRALVAADQDDVRVVRVDPNAVVVVAARRAFDGREGVSAIGGPVRGRVGDIDL